jgi:hypothetical protein
MLQSGIKSSGPTLDPYGPRTNANLGKFIVRDFGLSEFGEKQWRTIVKIPKFMGKFEI